MIDFYSHPATKNMNPVKLRLLKEIGEKAKGQSIESMLPQIMAINRELKKRNLSFTKQESDLLLDILMEDLTPAEKQKFNLIKTMMNQ